MGAAGASSSAKPEQPAGPAEDIELALADAKDHVRVLIWSGLYDRETIYDAALDIAADGEVPGREDDLMLYFDEEFERKVEQERTWPAVTDCDRLDAVFDGLMAVGIYAAQNPGFTLQEGRWNVEEAVAEKPKGSFHGFCFYHGQDLARAVDGMGLMLGFGDLADDDSRTVAVGHTIQRALQDAGFETTWDGTADQRINLPSIDWKRRLKTRT